MTLQIQLWYPSEVLIQEKQTLINWKYNNSQTLAENDPNSDPTMDKYTYYFQFLSFFLVVKETVSMGGRGGNPA